MSKTATKKKEQELEQAVDYLNKVRDGLAKMRTFDRTRKEYQRLKLTSASPEKLAELKTKMLQNSRIEVVPGQTILLKIDDREAILQNCISETMKLEVAAFKAVVSLRNACPSLVGGGSTVYKSSAPKISIPPAPTSTTATTATTATTPGLSTSTTSSTSTFSKFPLKKSQVPLVVAITPEMKEEMEREQKLAAQKKIYKTSSASKVCRERVKNLMLEIFQKKNIDKFEYTLETMRSFPSPETLLLKSLIRTETEKIITKQGLPLFFTENYITEALDSIMMDAFQIQVGKMLLECGLANVFAPAVVEFVYELWKLEVRNILAEVEQFSPTELVSEADATAEIIKVSRKNRAVLSLLPYYTGKFHDQFL